MSSDTEPRRGMERDFQREKVLHIVALQLIDATRIRIELANTDEENLKTCEREYRRLLAASCLYSQQPMIAERFLERSRQSPTLVTADKQIRAQLTSMLREVRRELSQIKADRKKVNGKCATLSQIVQELATYLWRCQMIQVFYPLPPLFPQPQLNRAAVEVRQKAVSVLYLLRGLRHVQNRHYSLLSTNPHHPSCGSRFLADPTVSAL
jgi:hypothetical protein